MPKYEIGYILSSAVSDDDITNVTAEISRMIEGSGATILGEDHWGRKKLAYPIGRTRNGYYAFISANVPGEKVQEIEHKLNTAEHVIRFIVVNMEDADKRKAKDEAVRAARPQAMQAADAPEAAASEEVGKSTEQPAQPANLDQEIEKAISGE